MWNRNLQSNINIVSKGTNMLYLDLKQHHHLDLTKYKQVI